MRRILAGLWLVGSAAWLASGCGSSTHAVSDVRGTAGTSSAGRGGAGAKGGVGGKATASGGQATGGSAGVAVGAGGRGGAAPMPRAGRGGGGGSGNASGGGGTGDQGGIAGAGEDGGIGGAGAGAGGECTAREPSPLGASCADAGGDLGATVTTTCSLADTCAVLGCGEPSSPFDQYGCRRPWCRSSDTCGTGERCVPTVFITGHADCYASVYENCEPEPACGACSCAATEDCQRPGFCLPSAAFPPEGDCPLVGRTCDELRYLASELHSAFESGINFDGDTAASVTSCMTAVAAAVDVCDGGAGAGSGAGGAAGGP